MKYTSERLVHLRAPILENLSTLLVTTSLGVGNFFHGY